MATASELRQVLVANSDKRDSPEYAELYKRYKRRESEEKGERVRSIARQEPDFLDQIEELAKGIPAGIIGLGELGALGAAALLDEESELPVRAGIKSVAKTLRSPFTADAGSEELVGRKFGEALGSFAGLGLTSLIPGAGIPAAAALAAGAGAGEASERARAADATLAERGEAALKGLGVGLTELIPLGKLRSLRSVLGENAFLNGIERIKRAAVAGGFEGAQEAAAGVLQNAIQRGYDPTQDLLNVEVAEEGGYGAAVGATVQALLDAAVPRRRGDSVQSTLSDEQQAQIEEELLAQPDTSFDDEGAPLTTEVEAKEDAPLTTEVEAKEEEKKEEVAEEEEVDVAKKKEVDEERKKLYAKAVATAQEEFAQGSDFSLKELIIINEKLLGLPTTDATIINKINIAAEIKKRQAETVTDKVKEGEVVTDKVKEGEVVTGEVEKKDTAEAEVEGEEVVVGEAEETVTGEEEKKGKTKRKRKKKEEETTDLPISTPSSRVRTTFPTVPNYALVEDTAKVKEIGAAEGTVGENTPKLGDGYKNAATYFSKYDRIEDAVEAIAFDYADKQITGAVAFKQDKENPSPEEVVAMMQGTGGAKAEAAYNWVIGNMSDAVTSRAKKSLEVYKTSLKDIEARTKLRGERDSKRLAARRKKFEKTYIEGTTYLTVEDSKKLKDLTARINTEKKSDNPDLNKISRLKNTQRELRAKTYKTIEPEFFFKEAKDLKLEFTREEKLALDIKREDFLKTKEASAKQRAKEDEARTASEIVDIDVPEAGTVGTNDKELLSEIETEVLKQRGYETTYLTDGDRKKLKNLTEKINTEEKSDNPNFDKLSMWEGQRRALRAKAYKKGSAIERGLEESSRGLPAEERQRRADLEEITPFSYPLPAESLSELTRPVDQTTATALASNDLKGALDNVSKVSVDKHIKTISKKFAALAGDTQIKVVKNLKSPKDARRLAGSFDPKTNTIELDSVLGLNEHTLLHEMAHALGSAQLSNKKSAFTVKVTNLHEASKELFTNPQAYESVDEFFSEALGNQEFRKELARINPDGSPKSALARLMDIIRDFLSKKLGIKVFGQSSSTLSEIDAMVDSIIDVAPLTRNAEVLAMNADVHGVEKLMGGLGKLWRSVSSPATKTENTRFRDGTLQFLSDSKRAVGQVVLGAVDLPGIAEIAREDFQLRGYKLNDIAQEQRGAMEVSDKRADAVGNVLIRFRDKYGEEVYNKFSDLIYDMDYGATIHQIDPLIPRNVAKGRYDADTFARWEILHKKWKDLNNGTKGESVRAYKILRNYYKQQYKELKEVLYDRVRKLSAEEQKTVQSEVLDLLFTDKVLDVYFPLARKGRFKVAYSLKKAPAVSSGDARLSDNYVMEMVETEAEALRIVEQLKKEDNIVGDPDIIDTKFMEKGGYQSLPLRAIEELLQVTDQKLKSAAPMTKQEEAIREDVRNKIIEVFIESLPETSYAKSLAKRQNIMGFEKDPLFALQTKGYDLGRQVVRIKYTKKVNEFESRLIEYFKENRQKLSKEAPILYEEMMERASFIRNPPADLVWQTLNQGAFVYTIGFNASSAIVNLSQLPLFTYPYLAGEYQNNTAAFNEIMRASSFVTSSFSSYDVGIDNYYIMDTNGNYKLNRKRLKELTEGMAPTEAKQKEKELEQLMPLVDLAAKRGQLTKSFIMDELSLQKGAFKSGRERSGNVFRQALDKITGISAMGFNVAERFNRQSTMVAAYNLELRKISGDKKGYKFTETELKNAAEKALYITQETNGGAFREVGPRLSQQGWKRVALMYKTYGFRMYQTMIKAGVTAIKGTTFSSDPKENARMRKVAIRQLVGWHLSSALFAGVYGIPLYGAISLFVDAVILDDEEDDADNIVRKYLGDLAYKGPINELLNVDIASRVRLTGLLIQSNKYNSNASAEETIGFYIGGPALSTAKRFQRGTGYLLEGEIERGIENMLPAGISNFIKASPMGRVYREGYSTQRGDPIYDDVTTGELAGQMFGFAPVNYIRKIEENLNVKGIDTKVRSRRSKLLKKLYIGLRTNNLADQRDVREEIAEFNKRHPLYRIDAGAVKRSMRAHQRTSALMHNGVQLSPAMQTILRLEQMGG